MRTTAVDPQADDGRGAGLQSRAVDADDCQRKRPRGAQTRWGLKIEAACYHQGANRAGRDRGIGSSGYGSRCKRKPRLKPVDGTTAINPASPIRPSLPGFSTKPWTWAISILSSTTASSVDRQLNTSSLSSSRRACHERRPEREAAEPLRMAVAALGGHPLQR